MTTEPLPPPAGSEEAIAQAEAVYNEADRAWRDVAEQAQELRGRLWRLDLEADRLRTARDKAFIPLREQLIARNHQSREEKRA